MRMELLTEKQKQVLAFVAQEHFFADFYLSGGTALSAYHLKHRISDDLDFFTSTIIDTRALRNIGERLRTIIAAKEMRNERLYDRNLFFFSFDDKTELKCEFTEYPFMQLEPPQEQQGIKIDGLRDIAANKLVTILDRFEPKDFVDLFFIMRTMPELSLQKIRQNAEQKFKNKIGALFLGGELMNVERIRALPRMLKPTTIEELCEFFRNEAKKLKGEILE